MEEVKRSLVAVATMRERTALWEFVDARYRMCSEAQKWGVETRLVEEATIYVGDMRSKISRAVAESEAFTHVLLLDADSCPPESGLACLLAHDVDVVSGLYFMRSELALPVAYVRYTQEAGADLHGRAVGPNGERQFYRSVWPEVAVFLNENKVPAVNRPVVVGNPLNRPELIELDVCGAGFLLIKKEVLQSCADWSMDGCGEDVCWCERLRSLGFQIWLDPGVIVAHLQVVPLSTEHFKQGGEARRKAVDEYMGLGRGGPEENPAGTEGEPEENRAAAPALTMEPCVENFV